MQPQKLHRIRLPRVSSGTLSFDRHFQLGQTSVMAIRPTPPANCELE
jgi:hypothetical protein